MELTCGKDGRLMYPDTVQDVPDESEIRIWLKCPKCGAQVVYTLDYPHDVTVRMIRSE